MAHIFKKKRGTDDANIDLTPMLDVVFIMLIFFIVTASFVSEIGFDVDRPPPTPPEQLPPDSKRNIVLTVNEVNEIWLQAENRRIDIRSVRANVERLLAENPEAVVVVRAHEKAHAEMYVQIADQAYEAKESIRIALVTYE